MARRVECTACKGVPQSQAVHCHECKGLRYIEYNNCKHPDELVEYEAMTGGWLCKCGESGPWSQAEYDKWEKKQLLLQSSVS